MPWSPSQMNKIRYRCTRLTQSHLLSPKLLHLSKNHKIRPLLKNLKYTNLRTISRRKCTRMMIRERKGRIKLSTSLRRKDSNGTWDLWTNHFSKRGDPLEGGHMQSVGSSGISHVRKWKSSLRRMVETWSHWLIRRLTI